MKIMLKQDVHGTGKAGDIVTVSDGYASNFLIPRGLAVPADAGTINAANIRKQAAKHRVEVQRKNAQALAADGEFHRVILSVGVLYDFTLQSRRIREVSFRLRRTKAHLRPCR